MSIFINPSVSHIAAQGATAAPIVLQPGSVITARVLQSAGNTVQIAINGHPVNVLSQVPLQAGQTLQLAVSQTADGIRLAVVDQQPAAGPSGTTSATTSPGNAPVTTDTVTLAPSAVASIAAQTTPAVAPTVQLTPQETLAVLVATQSAATQQTGLAPLFANLNVAAGLDNLPPQVQQAVAQLLSQQVNLDQNLTGSAIKQAFQNSGLFLEASLASGSVSTVAPDLKAALIVLRQVLTTSLASAAAQVPTAPLVVAAAVQQPASAAQPNAVPTAPVGTVMQDATLTAAEAATLAAIIVEQGTGPIVQASLQPGAITVVPEATASLAPVLASEIAAPQVPLAGTATAVVQDVVNFGALGQAIAPTSTVTDAAALAAASGAAINLLQEAVQAGPMIAGIPSQLLLNNATMLSLLPAAAAARTLRGDDADIARINAPPPPISGGVPTAQPVVPATLVTNSPAETAMHHLLADTDGAIARQILLQVASLPERTDASGQRVDAGASHWNFEIPFATPQGTAMAQFEISRDSSGNEVAATKRVWRARFSLDVEPAGPVHALISYSSERTSVRMWAERPGTVAQLRTGAGELSQALVKAELQPGDILVQEGSPPQAASAKAGHFLNRAL
jgi:Flagellar hook-length control protein FliK